ncbi:MAG: ABC transporter substrate-binding protein [Proteobacteria bacterium]|nr:ABC transporter substrate-binding protein [Pseudomonadota bacterium]
MRAIGRRTLGLSAGAAGLVGLSGLRAAEAATPRNALVLGHLAELETLDPAQATTISDFRILSSIYEGLLRFKSGTLEVEPALAKSWTISPDGKTYTFKLRDDVTFHDGTKFDASAVKFNLDRVLVKGAPFSDTGPFPFVFILGPITSTEVIDPTTVVIHLSQPYAPMLNMLASGVGLLVGISPAEVKQFGKSFSRHGGGAGPFKFRLWEPNVRIVLEANASYFRGAPKLKGLVFRPIPDSSARVSEMLSGGTDLMVEVPADDVPLFKSKSQFVFVEQPGPHLWYLMLNCRQKPFSDVRVRQALNYAINKQAIADQILKGTAKVADSVTPPAFTGFHDDSLKPYPYDPAKAKQLLAEAGYPNGVDVVFDVTQNGSGMLSPVLMGTAIQADLAAVGIRAKIETYEWNTYLAKLLPGMGKVDIAEMSFMTSDPDMLPALALRTGAAVNSGYFSDPEVDKLIAAGRAETDLTKREAIYKQLQQVVYKDAPWGFIVNWKQNAVMTDKVHGFELQPSFLMRLDTVYKS